ncbi:hypothetical protein C1646_673713 [Rhizophagus diaphanus]|nr:hypothetical protein C1646_673713 [Rhizophagus diaphanus] [Rhizophagus sp. MUCL 43196]
MAYINFNTRIGLFKQISFVSPECVKGLLMAPGNMKFKDLHKEMQERTRLEVINILGDNLTIPTSEQLKEMNYVNAIIKESLRIHPPATLTNFRKPSKPIS